MSASCKEASAWIEDLLLTQHFTLSSDIFSIGILMCLRLPIPLTRGLTICLNSKYSATVDTEGLHLLACNKGHDRVRLHDGMVQAGHSLIISTGLREQHGFYPNQRRTNIVLFQISVRVVSFNWTSLQLIPAFRQTSIWHLVNQGQRLLGGSRRRGITTATAMTFTSPLYGSIMVTGGSQQVKC